MKKFILLISFIFAGCLIQMLSAQDMSTSMISVLEEGNTRLQRIENNSDNSVVHIEFEFMKDNGYYGMVYQRLYSHHTYKIVAFGDPERFSDLDLYVDQLVDDEWKEIEGDTSASKDGLVTFKPAATEFYRLRIYGKKLLSDYTSGYYGIIIYY